MKHFLILLLLLSTSISLFSQTKEFEKARQYNLKGNYKGALKQIDKALEYPDYKYDPVYLIFKSEMLYKLSKDEAYVKKNPNVFKDALKYAEKSVQHDSTGRIRNVNKEYLDEIISLNNKEGRESFDQGRYPKAITSFKRSTEFGADTFATVMLGESYWADGNKLEAIKYFKTAVNWIYEAYLDSTSVTMNPRYKEPFRKLTSYYLDKKSNYDTAWTYDRMGVELFPYDLKLKEYNYTLMRISTYNMRPSQEFLSLVKLGLREYPEDSFFNVKENSLYFFLLNNAISLKEYGFADSLAESFAESKIQKSKYKQLGQIRKYDVFVYDNKTQVYFEWAMNLLTSGLTNDAKFIFSKWSKEATGKGFESAESYTIAIKSLLDQKNLFLIRNLYDFAVADFPANKTFKEGRRDYTKSKNLALLGSNDLVDLVLLNLTVAADFPKDAEFKSQSKRLMLMLIDRSADSGNFKLANKYFVEATKRYPEEKAALKILQRKIAEQDFIYNYAGTKVTLKGKPAPGAPEYNWNGVPKNCEPGKMSEAIQFRIIDRINYFRRNSGVSEEAVLTKQYNEYCEWAALMCEVNKTMSHEPDENWQCFTPAGLDALKVSILSKDQNPSISVTAAMGQNHKTMGFRRWMQYPKSKYMGVGAAINYTAIWAVDNSGEVDSAKYSEKFIGWPYSGFVPDMLLFKKWTFSLDKNLVGALVTMKYAGGDAIELVQEEIINGYGLPTIVWEPKITAAEATDKPIEVTVTLKNGKVYKYEVNVFKPKL
ncbi:MAG: tetratricopeptide repeat protein [Bacteroidia bacterium]|nr:tetratricopeptide repeat protein [Bacteroidia bacterium]